MNLRKKMNFTECMRTGAITLSAAALLCALPAMSQAAGGGMPQQQPQSSPSQQQPPMNTQGNSGPMQEGMQSSKMMDKAFLRKALEGGNAEVQLGQLAQQKASADDVKQFGSKMVEDHTKLGDQMKPIAQQMGVNPPDGVSGKDKALMTKLQSASGDQFDKMYIEAMLKDHRQDIKAFKNEAANGQDPNVKNAASQALPTLEGHLQMIEQIAKAHNLPEGGKMKMKSGQ